MLNKKEKIRMQFRKARNKEYADNFEVFEGDTDVVVKIFGEDNKEYGLTEEAIMEYERAINYSEIKKVYWQCENPIERKEMARRMQDTGRVVIEKKDGTKITLEKLGRAYQPLITALEEILKTN